MTYLKITTSLQTSETTSFSDPPDILAATVFDTSDAATDGESRHASSRTVLAPTSDDGPDPLLVAGDLSRYVSVYCLPDSPVSCVITYDGVTFCIVPGGYTMNFVALGGDAAQAKYGFYSNGSPMSTDQCTVRIITATSDTF